MKLTRITDIVHEEHTWDRGLRFIVDGKPRDIGSEVNRVILQAGWVHLYGLTDEEMAAPMRKVTITSGPSNIDLWFDAGWSDDPEVLYLVRRWLADGDMKRILPPGPYDPGEDGPILE